ncbi:hypothetical protein M5K25_012971 [Dendrobium thyrsiflorum]|uniref:Reverse transcriptase zinc-binding domain-containing protein n=1 Tax=Dendrobium thyrsiflorum TaxID=117978 RepID=A0ABD0UZB6_DENTH
MTEGTLSTLTETKSFLSLEVPAPKLGLLAPASSSSLPLSLFFSPLPNSSSPSLAAGPSCPLSWDRILVDPLTVYEFPISSMPTPEDIIDFPTANIADAVEEWNLALVGYSLGKRPFYEALRSAVLKLWNLKGNIKLISVSDGFFLFKFSCSEDYDMVWSRGAWFIFDKPFIFQRWSSHFSPKREEFTSVPIWFKIHDLPLCCWTPVGISKIATKIGQPLAVDALTASKSRLTYARVYVQVDSSASYADFVPISVEVKLFNLKINMNGARCFVPFANPLTIKPTLAPPILILGRSMSHGPRPPSKNPKGILPTPSNLTSSNIDNNTTTSTSVLPNHPTVEFPTTSPLAFETAPPNHTPADIFPPSEPASAPIPNLNYPTLPSSSSSDPLPPPILSSPFLHSSPSKTLSPNKFSVLQALSESETTSTHDPDVQTDVTVPTNPTSSSPTSKVLPSASQSKAASQPHRNIKGKGSRKCPNSSAITYLLSGWKAKLLSFAGRTQYIKYTISNLVAYWIRGSTIPKTILKAIGKACSKFLYHGGSQSKHLHLISWTNTTKPHSRGGLGIASFHASKFAFNCGIIIRLYNLDCPLSRWLRIRFTSPWKTCPRLCSGFWKSICTSTALFKYKLCFHVSPNSHIAISWDHWCFNNNITSLVPDFPNCLMGNPNATLADWINGCSWSLPDALSHNIKEVIHSIPISPSCSYHITWDNNENANFKDFYSEFCAVDTPVNWSHLVWHKYHSLRYSVFTWMALCGGLKTVDALSKRNIHIEYLFCPLCHGCNENTAHILFECDYSSKVLTKLIPQLHIFYLRPNIVQVLLHNDGFNFSRDIKCGIMLILHATVYFLWKERNNQKFNNTALCAISLSKKIIRAVYLKLDKWKCGKIIKEKLHLNYS